MLTFALVHPVGSHWGLIVKTVAALLAFVTVLFVTQPARAGELKAGRARIDSAQQARIVAYIAAAQKVVESKPPE